MLLMPFCRLSNGLHSSHVSYVLVKKTQCYLLALITSVPHLFWNLPLFVSVYIYVFISLFTKALSIYI